MVAHPKHSIRSKAADVVAEERRLNDIVWGRPVFRAPELPNPRVVFDPLPFRTQLFRSHRPASAA